MRNVDFEINKMEYPKKIILFNFFRFLMNGNLTPILIITKDINAINNWLEILNTISKEDIKQEYLSYKKIEKGFDFNFILSNFEKYKKKSNFIISDGSCKHYKAYDIIFFDKYDYDNYKYFSQLESYIITYLENINKKKIDTSKSQVGLFKQFNFYINSSLNNTILFLLSKIDNYFQNINKKTIITPLSRKIAIQVSNHACIEITDSNDREIFQIITKENKFFIDDVPMKLIFDCILEYKQLNDYNEDEFKKYYNKYVKFFSTSI